MINLLAFCLLNAEPDAFTAEVRKSLPVEGTLLLQPGIQALTPEGPPDLMKFVRGQTLQVEITKAGDTAYAAQVSTPGSGSRILKGDTVFAAFEVRSLAGGRETGEGTLTLHCQLPRAPWENYGSVSASVGRQWRRILFSSTIPRDLPAGDLSFSIHVAQQAQTFEFRNFTALNLGQGFDVLKLPFNRMSYVGQEPDAPWRKKAAQMIEQNRKAPLTLVVERNGRPVSGAQVDLKLARHEYPFATFLDTDPTLNTQDAAKYRELVPKLFNQVTVPIYWADWGWESAESRAGYFNRFRWARSQGLPMKAHNLVWPSFKWSPSRLQQLRDNPTALRNAILGEAEERAKALADQPFVNVDVLNELKSEYEFAEIVGKGIYKELFDLSRRTWPKAELVYNDYDVFEGGGLNEGPREVTKRLIRELIADKAPLTKIGWQGHFGESATPPEVVWKLLDEFWNEFKLPIEITEFDVDTRDERSQADYTRDLLTAWFAHPRTAGFTMWGFHETYHWRPNGAMFRRDWTPKPNLAEWTNLTQKVWTTQSKGVTNRSGQVRIRGFRGTYTVKVTSGGKTSTHSAKLTGNGSLIVVKLP